MDIPLFVVEVVGFSAFLYITLRLFRMYRRYGVQDLLLPSISFLFLSASQLCASLSIVYSDIKVSTSLYVATSTIAIAAFIVMIMQRRYIERIYVVTPYILVIMFPDVAAGLLSTYVAVQATGYTKALLYILSTSYYLRAISILVSVEISPTVLLMAELIRSVSAVALALYSSTKVLRL